MQINKDDICENNERVDYDYKVRDKVMLNNHAVYTFEMPYKGPFVITKCLTTITVKLQCGVAKVRYNIRHINPNTYGRNIKDMNF